VLDGKRSLGHEDKQLKQDIIDYLKNFIGLPYEYGSNGPLSFDCSGLICEGLRSIGLLGRTDMNAQDLCFLFRDHPKEKAVIGDLLFFGKDIGHVTHVAICCEDGFMLEAGGGDSKTKTLADAKKTMAMVRIRPIKWRGDLIAIRGII